MLRAACCHGHPHLIDRSLGPEQRPALHAHPYGVARSERLRARRARASGERTERPRRRGRELLHGRRAERVRLELRTPGETSTDTTAVDELVAANADN